MSEPAKTEPLLEPARAGRLLAFADEWVRTRPRFVVPMCLCFAVLLVVSGYDRTRVWVVLATLTVIVVHTISDAARARGTVVTPTRLAISSAAVLVDYAICAGATGGLESPFVPLLIGIPISSTMAYGASRTSRGLIGLFFVIVGILTFLPDAVSGLPVPEPWGRIGFAAALAYAVTTSSRNLNALADAYVGAAERVAVLRESVLEQQKERVRSLEAMGASLAHELKNPLAAISGLVQLLERNATDPKSKERLATVASEVTRMRERLADSLRFARPLTALRVSTFEPQALADAVVAVLEARAESASVALERLGEAATMKGDRRKLEEALLNLVGNAIEATDRGGRVELIVGESAGAVTFDVVDTGRGMPVDVLSRVGKPYFTTRAEGTGLGVVLARGVAEQHEGTLTYESRAGIGTRARLAIPRKEGADDGSNPRRG